MDNGGPSVHYPDNGRSGVEYAESWYAADEEDEGNSHANHFRVDSAHYPADGDIDFCTRAHFHTDEDTNSHADVHQDTDADTYFHRHADSDTSPRHDC